MASKMKQTVVSTQTEATPEEVSALVSACNSECHDGEELAYRVLRFLFGDKLNEDQRAIIVGRYDGSFSVEPNYLGGATVSFEEEWPDTYRCRKCGSRKVSALAWVGINENNDIGVGDYYSTNIEDPDDKHVQCDSCGHLGGVYGPGEGPDDGIYPSPCDPSDA